MIGFVKLAALSAALSCSVVTAYNMPVLKLEAAVGGKYQDRILAQGELTVHAKVVENTSVLTRVPSLNVASR
jgi:hypothetical protein